MMTTQTADQAIGHHLIREVEYPEGPRYAVLNEDLRCVGVYRLESAAVAAALAAR